MPRPGYIPFIYIILYCTSKLEKTKPQSRLFYTSYILGGGEGGRGLANNKDH
jgi:hypothetical protein